MVSPVDPNEVLLTGENSFMRLSEAPDGPLTTRASHWRVLLSPAGPGHVLFIESMLTGDEVRIYSDNIALVRWLQGEIESTLHAPFADQEAPVIEADFSRHGDVRSYSTEVVLAREGEITLTWYDFGEPFLIRTTPGAAPGRPHGVYSVMIPARRAQLVMHGELAPGRPFPQARDGREGSTCCLAWSETWVRPR